jgi:hypothetical protein
MFLDMAANASARGQRVAILGSPLHELDGFLLAVDCGSPNCRGERSYAVADLAGMFGRRRTLSDVLHRMRCAECGAAVAAAWLQTGTVLNQRVRRAGWR